MSYLDLETKRRAVQEFARKFDGYGWTRRGFKPPVQGSTPCLKKGAHLGMTNLLMLKVWLFLVGEIGIICPEGSLESLCVSRATRHRSVETFQKEPEPP